MGSTGGRDICLKKVLRGGNTVWVPMLLAGPFLGPSVVARVGEQSAKFEFRLEIGTRYGPPAQRFNLDG